MHDFEQAWKLRYPNSFPVGHMMRDADEPNWLRFHSLPYSKQYAESAKEKKILLARQNKLADEVLVPGNPIWLVQACWEARKGVREASIADEEFRACRKYGLAWSFRFLVDEGDDEEHAWNVHAGRTVWRTGEFDELLWAIADDQTRAIWMSVPTGAVFAPYDGGVDLFLPSQQMVQELRLRHPMWLPDNPEGL